MTTDDDGRPGSGRVHGWAEGGTPPPFKVPFKHRGGSEDAAARMPGVFHFLKTPFLFRSQSSNNARERAENNGGMQA